MQHARTGTACYRIPESGAFKRATLMSRDMLGLVAFNFILGIIFRRVMSMTFVVEVAGMNLDDRARYPSRLRIPAHVIADFELLGHLPNSSFLS